jgi:hypothetical protein
MRTNVPLKGNKHWFEDAVEKAGIKDFTWHCLRHTFGSWLAARGVDLRKIQELMGHKDIKMTVRYTHLSQPDLLAAVEQLDGKVFDFDSGEDESLTGSASIKKARGISRGRTATRTATNQNMALSNVSDVVQ